MHNNRFSLSLFYTGGGGSNMSSLHERWMIAGMFEKQLIKKYARKYSKLQKIYKMAKKFEYDDVNSLSNDVIISGIKFFEKLGGDLLSCKKLLF